MATPSWQSEWCYYTPFLPSCQPPSIEEIVTDTSVYGPQLSEENRRQIEQTTRGMLIRNFDALDRCPKGMGWDGKQCVKARDWIPWAIAGGAVALLLLLRR